MTDEERILGVFTKDEFYDTLLYALLAGVVTAVVTIILRYVQKWLELKEW